MTLPSLHRNRWVNHPTPLCWITAAAAIEACASAENREQLRAAPIRIRFSWWWAQLRVQTVRALFL